MLHCSLQKQVPHPSSVALQPRPPAFMLSARSSGVDSSIMALMAATSGLSSSSGSSSQKRAGTSRWSKPGGRLRGSRGCSSSESEELMPAAVSRLLAALVRAEFFLRRDRRATVISQRQVAAMHAHTRCPAPLLPPRYQLSACCSAWAHLATAWRSDGCGAGDCAHSGAVDGMLVAAQQRIDRHKGFWPPTERSRRTAAALAVHKFCNRTPGPSWAFIFVLLLRSLNHQHKPCSGCPRHSDGFLKSRAVPQGLPAAEIGSGANCGVARVLPWWRSRVFYRGSAPPRNGPSR